MSTTSTATTELIWVTPYLLDEVFGPCRGNTNKCTGYMSTCIPCRYWHARSLRRDINECGRHAIKGCVRCAWQEHY